VWSCTVNKDELKPAHTHTEELTLYEETERLLFAEQTQTDLPCFTYKAKAEQEYGWVGLFIYFSSDSAPLG